MGHFAATHFGGQTDQQCQLVFVHRFPNRNGVDASFRVELGNLCLFFFFAGSPPQLSFYLISASLGNYLELVADTEWDDSNTKYWVSHCGIMEIEEAKRWLINGLWLQVD